MFIRTQTKAHVHKNTGKKLSLCEFSYKDLENIFCCKRFRSKLLRRWHVYPLKYKNWEIFYMRLDKNISVTTLAIQKNLISISKFCKSNKASIEFFPFFFLLLRISTRLDSSLAKWCVHYLELEPLWTVGMIVLGILP